MRIRSLEFEHPTQASRVRLHAFEQPAESPVAGMPSGGFLVTEERVGTTKVISTLGAFPDREAALACLDERAKELQGQRWRALSPPA